MAAMFGKFYVVGCDSNVIYKYENKSPYAKDTNVIEVVNLQKPGDMVACENTRFLYVSDIGGEINCVYKVDIGGKTEKLDITPLSPGMLFVTPDDCLVLPSPDQKLSCYSPNGKLAFSVHCPTSDKSYIMQRVISCSGYYFVSYNKAIVYKFDKMGKVRGKYKFTDEAAIHHLAVIDEQSGIVTGALLQGIISETPLVEELSTVSAPIRLCYVNKRCLLIGTDNCAYVYDDLIFGNTPESLINESM